MVAVGLYYRVGYRPGEPISPESVGLEPVLGKEGEPIVVRVPVEDRVVQARAWKWKRAALDVLLLDTDLEANTPTDRRITDRLYVDDKQTRLKQQIVLGIGGLRLLEALDIHPSVYHLNEGHSAMLTLELVRHQMLERGLGFDEAKQFARRRTVLTNHTLVPAGNETFNNDLAATVLARYGEELSVPVSDLVKLGLVQESSIFSMTMLAFRMSAIINSVSKLHAKKAKEIWTDHPMAAVTNGIHVPTWDRVKADVSAHGAFWKIHQERKRELLGHIEAETGRKWDEDALLLGWARRIVRYKRPTALLEDAKRFAAMARNADRPVRVVFAGNPHPSDEEGTALQKELRALIDGELSDVACYLPRYDLATSPLLIGGCDVWLNTPVVGFEACGTSGMKAALNGGLPCSTRDGWVAEVELYRVGWALQSERVGADLLDVIERDIAPMYYSREDDGVPALWEEHMRNARAMALNQFSATRMLRGYIETLYS
jgi:glucan phosphorylase